MGACVHAPGFDSAFLPLWVGLVKGPRGGARSQRALPGVFNFRI